jgi:hypothetical protein
MAVLAERARHDLTRTCRTRTQVGVVSGRNSPLSITLDREATLWFDLCHDLTSVRPRVIGDSSRLGGELGTKPASL